MITAAINASYEAPYSSHFGSEFSDVRMGETCEVLSKILHPGISLSLWVRDKPPKVGHLLASLVASRIPLSLDAHVEDGQSILSVWKAYEWMNSASLAIDPLVMEAAFAQFVADIDLLIARFRSISGSDRVRVRLSRVVDAACALFHVDTLTLRLLCTYHGAGTQWVPDALASRKQLGLRGRSMRKANSAIVRNAEDIQTMGEWHVGILKGRAFPGDSNSALIHRSHPQCCESHARLRLVLDTDDH